MIELFVQLVLRPIVAFVGRNYPRISSVNRVPIDPNHTVQCSKNVRYGESPTQRQRYNDGSDGSDDEPKQLL